MTPDQKHPEPARGHTDDSKNGSADSAAGTETAVKGGSGPAKRQAERDWKDSPKEEGE
jgi:hypothetical protein